MSSDKIVLFFVFIEDSPSANRDRNERELALPFPRWKGGESQMKYSDHEKKLEHQFDSYCKTVLRNFARDIYAAENFRNSLFISIDTLTEDQLSKFSFADEYNIDYSHFPTSGEDVFIKHFLIAQAVASLSEQKQDIILLSYFLHLTNAAIASLMNLSESTIHYHKVNALNELRTYLEEHKNDQN